MPTDHLSFRERLRINQEEQAKVIECLNKSEFLLKDNLMIVPSTSEDDRRHKIDGFVVDRGGDHSDRSRPVAVKVRETGDDIEMALKDPWFGPDHPDSREGRDVQVEYFLYIVRSKDKTKVYAAPGKPLLEIANGLWDEWIHRGYEDKPEFQGKVKMRSDTYAGCEVHRHYDKNGFHERHPKILAYIPPKLIKGVTLIPYSEQDANAG